MSVVVPCMVVLDELDADLALVEGWERELDRVGDLIGARFGIDTVSVTIRLHQQGPGVLVDRGMLSVSGFFL